MTQAVGRAPPSSRLILRPRAFTGLLSSETVAVSPTSFAQSQWGRQGVWASECKGSRRSVPAAGLSSGLGGGPDRCVTQVWESSWELDGGLRQALSLRTEQSPGAVSRPWRSLTLENPEAEVGRNGATHSRGEGPGVGSSSRVGPHQVRAAVGAHARPVETHRSIEQAQGGNPVPREGRVPGRRAVQSKRDLSLPGLEDRVPLTGPCG